MGAGSRFVLNEVSAQHFCLGLWRPSGLVPVTRASTPSFSFITILIALIAPLLLGCNLGGGRSRPQGFMRLGPIGDLAAQSETFLPEVRIMVRHDSGGFSAMSTECTYDLAALSPTRRDGKVVWTSPFSTSTYDEFGRVLSGPARKNLPFFKLRVEAGSVGQGAPERADTLFIEIGAEVPETWRLAG